MVGGLKGMTQALQSEKLPLHTHSDVEQMDQPSELNPRAKLV